MVMAFQAAWLRSPPHKPGLSIAESNDFQSAGDADGLVAVVATCRV